MVRYKQLGAGPDSIRSKFTGTADIAVGGGAAAGAAVLARLLAPAGSFWARRAGSIGMVAGSLLSLAAREKLTGIVSALLVGGTVELVQILTDYRVRHPKQV